MKARSPVSAAESLGAGQTDVIRCGWPGIDDLIYSRYHDTEWGVPLRDSQALFEKLALESFQAGLSWLTILRKRDHFRTAFQGFDPERVARFDADDVARLMADTGIVRNRAKIEATIANAQAFLALSQRTSFSQFVWSFAPPHPSPVRDAYQTVPGMTAESKKLSKALKAEGFRFVGPTTVYSLMQSAGMVNDHAAACHRHQVCARLQAADRVAHTSGRVGPSST